MIMAEKIPPGEATLGFLVKDNSVWLALKSRNIGAGLWNGYGGGVEAEDQSLAACLKREVMQESGVEISEEGLEQVAIVDFHNVTSEGKTFVTRVHVFLIKNWKGVPQETKEMK